MQAPTLLEKSAEQITVQWTFAGEGFVYELYADYDTGSFEQVVETDSLFHVIAPLPSGRIFKFMIRARNSCDVSPWSPELTVVYASVPDQISEVTTQVEDCNLVINWLAPNDGGAPIRRYIVQFKDETGAW
jgi:hypothetical protein